MKNLTYCFKYFITPVCLLGLSLVLSNCSTKPQNTDQANLITDSTLTVKDSSQAILPVDSVVAIHDTTAVKTNTHKPLTLIIKNMQTPNGPIVVGVYGAKNKFLDEKDELKKYTLSPAATNGVLTIKDLEYGEFALALFQDVNSDGKINKNGIGIPKEPYAFSNNYKPVIKAPNFKDCMFAYTASSDTLVISMIR